MKTHIIYRRALFGWAVIYVMVCVGALIVFIEVLRSRPLIISGLVAIFLPLALLPLLFRLATKEVNIGLNPDQFSFEIMNNSGLAEKTIRLSQLVSYSIQLPTERFISVRFKIRGSRSHEFSFFTKKKDPSDTDTTELIDQFRTTINEYNGRQEVAGKIALRPSFYASSMGLYCIIGLSVLLFAGVLLVFYLGKSIPLAFITSLAIIFQLFSKRSNELEYYKRIAATDA